MTTEIVPAVPDLATIDARDDFKAKDVRDALQRAIVMLQAADIETSDADVVTFRGLGLARAVYPLLDEIEALVKKVRQRGDRLIGAYLSATRSTGVVLGGVPYKYEAKPGTYVYQGEKLHLMLKALVGKVLTEEEFHTVSPEVVIPEQIIPARKEYPIDGQVLARIIKKRGGEHVAPDMTFDAAVNQFRSRDPGTPRLAKEGK